MEQTVRLLGELGERYGAEHTYYNLRTPAEAIKLLCINYPKLQEELAYAHERGVGYQLVQADIELDYPDLHLPMGSKDLVLTPVIAGSGGGGGGGGGVGRILLGVGLIAASFFFPGAGLFGTSGLFGAGQAIVGVSSIAVLNAAAVGTSLSVLGASLVLGGVAELISPQPQVPTFEGFGGGIGGAARFKQTGGPTATSRATGGTQSYAYSGPANTVGVGATIPVAYGKVLIGSHLLSADIAVADDSDPVSQYIKEPGFDTILVGGEPVTNTFSEASGVPSRRTTYTLKRNYVADGKTFNAIINTDYALVRNKIYTIYPNQGITQTFPGAGSVLENNQIIFELRNGLFDYVGAKGTTKVDGYITYKIELEAPFGGVYQTVGGITSSVQGLLNPGQNFKWVQKIEFQSSFEGFHRWKLEILDFDSDASTDLRVHAIGYAMVK